MVRVLIHFDWLGLLSMLKAVYLFLRVAEHAGFALRRSLSEAVQT